MADQALTPSAKFSDKLIALRARLLGPSLGGGILTTNDERLLEQVIVMLTRMEQGEGFFVSNIVSRDNDRGKLDVTWMGQLAQMEPAEARAIAWMLLEAASLAEVEASLVRFLKAEIGVDAANASNILHTFRTYREQAPEASLVGHKPNA
jgi:hypothetical protein